MEIRRTASPQKVFWDYCWFKKTPQRPEHSRYLSASVCSQLIANWKSVSLFTNLRWTRNVLQLLLHLHFCTSSLWNKNSVLHATGISVLLTKFAYKYNSAVVWLIFNTELAAFLIFVQNPHWIGRAFWWQQLTCVSVFQSQLFENCCHLVTACLVFSGALRLVSHRNSKKILVGFDSPLNFLSTRNHV